MGENVREMGDWEIDGRKCEGDGRLGDRWEKM